MGKGREIHIGGDPICQQFEKLQVLQLENANPDITRERKSRRTKETNSQQKRKPQASSGDRKEQAEKPHTNNVSANQPNHRHVSSLTNFD